MDLWVKDSDHVLFVWGDGVLQEDLQSHISALRNEVGSTGRIAVENVDMLLISNHLPSSFDVAFLGTDPNSNVVHSADVLSEVARLLKPNGKLIIGEYISRNDENFGLHTSDQLLAKLKLSGFVNVLEVGVTKEIDEGRAHVKVSAIKPSYEVGSSVALKLPQYHEAPANLVNQDASKIWVLRASDVIDASVDLVDSDLLLDQEDLRKPDPLSLKVCGSTGKKKACKNCSCGLAEELASKKQSASPKSTVRSSCGSCYLGDAFRCASCPYMGMPAFKPGEQVLLSSD